jgi:hypothetical protein
MALRGQIGDAMNNHHAAKAASLYLDLLQLDSTQVLPRQLQLDVANQLMSEGHWQPSAAAYHKFLARYDKYEFAEQVHLMLGLLYSRYLNKPEEALKFLKQAKDDLRDAGQKRMCQQEIERLESGE